MRQFAFFWLRCLVEGWHSGHWALGFLEGVLLVASIFFGIRKARKCHQKVLEDFARQWAWKLFLCAFICSTLVMSPFLEWRDADERAKQQPALQSELEKTRALITVQITTIQSLQTELGIASRKLADIDAANDPSAKAVKRRALILCKQLADFYQQYRSEEETENDKSQQEDMAARQKLGWPPTNAIEKEKWKETSRKRFAESNRKREALESEWTAKFIADYYGRIIAMRDQLASLGLQSDTLNKHIPNPFFANVYWSQELTMEIARLANEIKE